MEEKYMFIPDDAVSSMSEVGFSAFSLYAHLCSIQVDRKCSPSQMSISTKTGLSYTYVTAAKKKLLAAGWIKVDRKGNYELTKGEFPTPPQQTQILSFENQNHLSNFERDFRNSEVTSENQFRNSKDGSEIRKMPGNPPSPPPSPTPLSPPISPISVVVEETQPTVGKGMQGETLPGETSEAPKAKKTAKPKTERERDFVWEKFCEVCKIEWRLLPKNSVSRLASYINPLRKANPTRGQFDHFAEWWKSDPWRKTNMPVPLQHKVGEGWPQAMEWRNPRNGKNGAAYANDSWDTSKPETKTTTIPTLENVLAQLKREMDNSFLKPHPQKAGLPDPRYYHKFDDEFTRMLILGTEIGFYVRAGDREKAEKFTNDRYPEAVRKESERSRKITEAA